MVPNTVEELLLRCHDLGELARLLLEVRLREELLDLLAEVAEQEARLQVEIVIHRKPGGFTVVPSSWGC